MRISDWSSDVCSSDLCLQALQRRLGAGDRFAQCRQPRLVAADVAADLQQRRLRFLAGALQALRHLALVRDLLLDPRQRAADLVDLGLRRVQRFARDFALAAAFLDPALGLALFRSEERRVGTEGVSTGRFRWSAVTSKK